MGVRTRGLDIKSGAAKADRTARLEAELAVDRLNRRLATGRDMLWSPTIRAALVAGTPWLDVFCPGCGTGRAIDLKGPSIGTRWPRWAPWCSACGAHGVRGRSPMPKLVRAEEHDRGLGTYPYVGRIAHHGPPRRHQSPLPRSIQAAASSMGSRWHYRQRGGATCTKFRNPLLGPRSLRRLHHTLDRGVAIRSYAGIWVTTFD
jgi:hypothetical protein